MRKFMLPRPALEPRIYPPWLRGVEGDMSRILFEMMEEMMPLMMDGNVPPGAGMGRLAEHAGRGRVRVADYIFEQQREEEVVDVHLIELGLRHQCTPLSVMAAGVGTGLAEDSPDLRVTFAFQRSF